MKALNNLTSIALPLNNKDLAFTCFLLTFPFISFFPFAFQVMVYLVEAVLPEGYFADDLRGLSADMAAFRDLLRLRLPRLAQHMDHLQRISDGMC